MTIFMENVNYGYEYYFAYEICVQVIPTLDLFAMSAAGTPSAALVPARITDEGNKLLEWAPL